VRFASECLAFATPPERWSTARLLPDGVEGEAWRAGVPRDRDTDWDFLDVTDHYVAELFGEALGGSTARGLDLRRAAAAHVMAEVFSDWRRDGSTCAGGLVLEWRDRVPGPGWGLLDSAGVPKSTWHALRRVLAPVTVLLTDEGLDGLRVHVANDRATPLDATLEVSVVGVRGAVEEASAAVRVDWSRSPCSATALKPCLTSDLCKTPTSRLRLQKIMAFLKFSAEFSSRRSMSRLS
jgi:beta-mannosidase